MTHRAPWECTFAKEQRSRCLPGKKPRMDREYFEILSLCILQAGLSWASVRRSWPRYRSALLNCEIEKLAHAAPAALLRRPGVLGNPKKLGALVANAQKFERIRAEHGTLTFGPSSRTRMRAQFCRSASGTWARTPPSSTCTAWGGPCTVRETSPPNQALPRAPPPVSSRPSAACGAPLNARSLGRQWDWTLPPETASQHSWRRVPSTALSVRCQRFMA